MITFQLAKQKEVLSIDSYDVGGGHFSLDSNAQCMPNKKTGRYPQTLWKTGTNIKAIDTIIEKI